MIFSAAGQSVTMAILAAMTQDTGNSQKGIVAAVMLFVFNFFFVSGESSTPVARQSVDATTCLQSCGFLAIPWLYPAGKCIVREHHVWSSELTPALIYRDYAVEHPRSRCGVGDHDKLALHVLGRHDHTRGD